MGRCTNLVRRWLAQQPLRTYVHQSTVEIGRHFESLVISVLQKFKFELHPSGGAHDKGVDFHGVWKLPGKDIPVIGQCKRESSKLGPHYIREFEGTLSRQPAGTFGIFAARNGFSTAAVRYFMQADHFPAVLTVVDENVGLMQFLMNDEARNLCPGIVVATSHAPTGPENSTKPLPHKQRVTLYYDGKPLSTDNE